MPPACSHLQRRIRHKLGRISVLILFSSLIFLAVSAAADNCPEEICNYGRCIQSANNPEMFECYCKSGFTGLYCDADIDECVAAGENEFCRNNGTCHNTFGGFECVCKERYRGEYCEEFVKACDVEDLCRNGGICVETETEDGFECICVNGFTGQFCHQDINECNETDASELSTLCNMRGRCVNSNGSYSCNCDRPFSGRHCQFTPCDQYPCESGGKCSVDVHSLDGYSCECSQGFEGKRCEVNVDDCVGVECNGRGICQDGVNNYLCVCNPGYTGRDCEHGIDDCHNNSCNETGTAKCVDGESSYRCECKAGYNGFFCEFAIDFCADPDLCRHGDCVNVVGGYECQCPGGFAGDKCQFRTCALVACENDGNCLETEGSSDAVCVCSEDWRGEKCEIPRYPCRTNPCLNGSICSELDRSDDNLYECFCKPDYYGRHCELRVDDCLRNECRNGATCVDLIADYECECSAGFEGEYCEKQVFVDDANLEELPEENVEDNLVEVSQRTTKMSTTKMSELPVSELKSKSTTKMIRSTLSTLATPTKDEEVTIREEGSSTAEDMEPTAAATEVEGDVSVSPCVNNATFTGSTCLCPLGFGGVYCSDKLRITPHAKFLGSSYLQLPEIELNQTTHTMDLVMHLTTNSRRGLLFFMMSESDSSASGTLILQNGALVFEGMCGFTRDRIRVNSGIRLIPGRKYTISLTLIFPTSSIPKCAASIQVNDKRVQAEKRVFIPRLLPSQIKFELVYLGGRDISRANFTGCISNFGIMGRELQLMRDAVQGWNITPCGRITNALHETLTDVSECEEDPCISGLCVDHEREEGTKAVPVCLCDFGFSGRFCENTASVREARFFGDNFGYASFVEYPPISGSLSYFQIQLVFQLERDLAEGEEQFLVYLGSLDEFSDFIAITLTQNSTPLIRATLRLGPHIQTVSVPFENSIKSVNHTLLFMLNNGEATMMIDLKETATTSLHNDIVLPIFERFDSDGRVFLGGVPDPGMLSIELRNFTGFEGCVLELKYTPSVNSDFYSLGGPVSGRNVLDCQDGERGVCKSADEEQVCGKNAFCDALGASYWCECYANASSTFDGKCQFAGNPCDASECENGGQCIPRNDLDGSYVCACPLGWNGDRCEKAINVDIPSFSSQLDVPSFLSIRGERFCLRRKTLLQMHVLARNESGLLFYAGGSHRHLKSQVVDFLSLSLVNGHIELRWNLGTLKTTSLRSGFRVRLGAPESSWIYIEVLREGTSAFLRVNNESLSGIAPKQMIYMDLLFSHVFIGGAPEWSALSPNAFSSRPAAFDGCIDRLRIGGEDVMEMARKEEAQDGDVVSLGLRNCASGRCLQGKRCENGGTCRLADDSEREECVCPEGYTGTACSDTTTCLNSNCAQNSECLTDATAPNGFTCLCQLGSASADCSGTTSLPTASFPHPRSYLRIHHELYNSTNLTETFIEFEFKSASVFSPESMFVVPHKHPNSQMILWTGDACTEHNDFIGVGLQKGRLKVVVNLGLDQHSVLVSNNSSTFRFDTDSWTTVRIVRRGKEIGVQVSSEDGFSYYMKTTSTGRRDYTDLNTNGVYYIGSFPNSSHIPDNTFGYFNQRFRGCVRNIRLHEQSEEVVDFLSDNVQGLAISECSRSNTVSATSRRR